MLNYFEELVKVLGSWISQGNVVDYSPLKSSRDMQRSPVYLTYFTYLIIPFFEQSKEIAGNDFVACTFVVVANAALPVPFVDYDYFCERIF